MSLKSKNVTEVDFKKNIDSYLEAVRKGALKLNIKAEDGTEIVVISAKEFNSTFVPKFDKTIQLSL